jgi:peroxiredoxin
MLTGYRGQSVLLAFISTQCVHCQKVSLVLEQLGREFSGRAQVMEIAFDENADAAAFKRRFGLTFPVGTESSAAVHGFLGIPAGARLATPQMVAIDRAGIIRAQSEREGTPLLQTADTLRSLLIALLRRAER